LSWATHMLLAGGSGGKQVVASWELRARPTRYAREKRQGMQKHNTAFNLMGIYDAQPGELGPAVVA
jgi:hypothetical protein